MFADARAWMPSDLTRGRAELLSLNARAAFAWNLGNKSEAMKVYASGIHRVKATDRLGQLHFWRNYSVLAAEAGDVETSEFAYSKCKELSKPQIDKYSQVTFILAQAGRLAIIGNFEESVERLSKSIQQCIEWEWILPRIYSEEALAEVLARAGDTQAAATFGQSLSRRDASNKCIQPHGCWPVAD